jgi:hypothetical protein
VLLGEARSVTADNERSSDYQRTGEQPFEPTHGDKDRQTPPGGEYVAQRTVTTEAVVFADTEKVPDASTVEGVWTTLLACPIAVRVRGCLSSLPHKPGQARPDKVVNRSAR